MIHLLCDKAFFSSNFSLKNPKDLQSKIKRMIEVELDVAAQLEELLPIILYTIISKYEINLLMTHKFKSLMF
jgi:hypothetical protein